MPAAESELVVRARQRIGTVLRGKYRLDRLLGTGGMASVYGATHLRNTDRVAVKILHPELSIDAGLRSRFVREGYAANSVGHPATVRVLDDDTAEDGSVFIVMDLLDGETLDARWERSERRLGVGEVVTLISELLDVLAAAHAKGVVHRDIKPENLFVTREGKLKVLDFGVARLRESSPTQTKTGAVFGTPAFMPPEQALGRTSEVDALSDVWAVGATAFCLLGGRFVHGGSTAEEVLVRSATEPAPPLVTVAPDVPTGIARVVDRALAFNKRDRWPSATAMREAFVLAELVERSGEDSDDEDRTKIALPPEMTLRGQDVSSLHPGPAKETLEITTLPLPAASTVAGIESHSESGRARRGFPFVAITAGGLSVAVATVLVVALAGGSKRPTATPSATTAANLLVAPEPSLGSSAAPAAMTSAGAVPVISFEALPLASPLSPAATTRRVPASVTRATVLIAAPTVRSVAPATPASTSPTFQASAPNPPPLQPKARDPLAP